jgi:hypothetical protein
MRKEDVDLATENNEIFNKLEEKKRKTSTLSSELDATESQIINKAKLGLRDRANLSVKAIKNKKTHKK